MENHTVKRGGYTLQNNMPARITIDTNPDICNLKCIMCDTHSIHNKDFTITRKSMSRELLQKSLDEAIDLGVKEIIPSTMGEPLLYPHFEFFIEKLKHSQTKLNLTTNSTFPKYGVEIWTEKLLPILSDIKISFNSLRPEVNEKIMLKANTKMSLKNIKYFAEQKEIYKKKYDSIYPTVTLQVTFLKSNLPYLKEVIEFAIEHNIERVKGHHLWITHEEVREESLKNSPEKIEKWNAFIDKIKKYRDKIKLENFTKIETTSNEQGDLSCPFLGKELWIDYNGDFNICCAPSYERKKLGYWGNIENIDIGDVFVSKSYRELLKTYKEKEVCQRCPLMK